MRRNNQVCLPINFENIISEEDEVITLAEVSDELDYSELYRKFRNCTYDPTMMFEIIVYGYMCNLYSTRKIETACRRDINFKWLLGDSPVPDHNTIDRFRTALGDDLKELFEQAVELLRVWGEIGGKNVFIDGTKIEANANRYSFVWKGSTEKYYQKNEARIIAFVSDYNSRYKRGFKKISTIKKHIESDLDKYGICFVSGKGKHKTQLQRDYEYLCELLAKRKKYQEYFKTLGDRNSFSKTDTDATFMRMKEDHMRNGQLKPAYNVQIAVDSEYIVNTAVFSNRTDYGTLIPFLKDTNRTHKYEKIVADAGYESEENYVFLNQSNQQSFIKPQNYEQLKKKHSKYSRYNFNYIPEQDIFICPDGNKMYPTGTKKSKSKSGYISEKTIYTTDKCQPCQNKDKCTKSKIRRQIHLSKELEAYRQQSLENITTEEGILLRMNRSIQVEGAFGVLKQDYNFRRFLTRGNKNVTTEIVLLCLAYNINKFNHKRRDKRTKTYLFEKQIA